MRTQVDVLTLTATPIPRTLQMAMAGLRDLSIIATPPADRRAIRTFVARPDDGVLREGIRRELARGGQVFFVVPRIAGVPGDKDDRSLEKWAEHLRELVPEAHVAIAHGQMPAEAAGEGDGRVRRRPPRRPGVHDDHRERPRHPARQHDVRHARRPVRPGPALPAARPHRPLEGARLLLPAGAGARKRRSPTRRAAGSRRCSASPSSAPASRSPRTTSRSAAPASCSARKQSGSIAAVGFETYAALLEEAVAELRGEPIQRPRDPELTVDVPGFIPDDYVPDTGQRLDLYKRLAGAADEDEVRAMLEEMVDRYGPLPARGVGAGRPHGAQGAGPPAARPEPRAGQDQARPWPWPRTPRWSRPR